MVPIFLVHSGTPFLLVLSFRAQLDKRTLDDSLTTASVPLTGSSVFSCNDGRQICQLGGVGRFNNVDPSKQKSYTTHSYVFTWKEGHYDIGHSVPCPSMFDAHNSSFALQRWRKCALACFGYSCMSTSTQCGYET